MSLTQRFRRAFGVGLALALSPAACTQPTPGVASATRALVGNPTCAQLAPESRNACNLGHLFSDVVSTGNLDLADQYITVDRPDHDPNLPPELQRGRDGFKRAIALFRAGFPDLKVASEFMVADGDKVTSYGTVAGTHNGTFLGFAPTHKTFQLHSIEIVRFDAAGLIAEHWGGFDIAELRAQLGLPSPDGDATRDVVARYYAAWPDVKRGDTLGVRAVLAPDVQFRGTIAPHLSGVDAFVEGLSGLVDHQVGDRRELQAVYSGEHASVLYELTVSGAGTIRFADYLRVVGGKIVEDDLVFDPTALRAVIPN
jgi:predicted ester cyclase